MSSWRSGKLQLKCSLGLLRKALTSIVKEWDQYIVEDEQGLLELYGYQGSKKGDNYYLVVPGKGDPYRAAAPGFNYSGLGVRKQKDGTWVIDVDTSGLPSHAKNIVGKVNAFVAAEKVRKRAALQGNNIVSETTQGGKTKILMTAPVDPKYKIHA